MSGYARPLPRRGGPRVFRPRRLDDFERSVLFDAACGLTAQQSAAKHGLTKFVIYEWQKKIRALYGVHSIVHAVSLAFAYGEFTPEDVLNFDERH